MKTKWLCLNIFGLLTIGSPLPALAITVPEVPSLCHAELNHGRECLISQVNCDNFLCLTGEFHHEIYMRIPRQSVGTKKDAIRKISRYEMWPAAVIQRDPYQSVMKVHHSIRGPFTYDNQGDLLEAIQYADFQANSPIGWQPITMITRFSMIKPAQDPWFGKTFITTKVQVDTAYDPSQISPELPWSRGIRRMDGYLHLIEENDHPESMLAIYTHTLRIGFDLAPRIAQGSIDEVIHTLAGALIDIMQAD